MNETWEGLIIIGMGNPLLSDDGVGLHAARALGRSFPGAAVHMTPMVGMDILELIVDYDSLCLVDAMTTGEFPLGAVSRFRPTGQGLHLSSSHGPDLEGLLSLGKTLGLNIPRVILTYGIEIGREIPYGEELTPELQKCFNGAVAKIAADMRTTLC
ncbi:MAG: hydrogenase maturation protease [Deltaproteobacteria bacterium]|nr:hydrogenase maturation protease [Deltaproteobacteria bacterium]